MCVLCGDMISAFHWSELDFYKDFNNERKKLRLKQAKLANAILKFYGLELKLWQNSKFLLSDKKGQSLIINDISSLWQEASKLCAKELDILDENLLAFLENG